jgi:hypothetical protein
MRIVEDPHVRVGGAGGLLVAACDDKALAVPGGGSSRSWFGQRIEWLPALAVFVQHPHRSRFEGFPLVLNEGHGSRHAVHRL